MVKHFPVKSTTENHGSDYWFFEEELHGNYVKYVGNDDFTVKKKRNALHSMMHALVHFDLECNGGRSFLCDLQGVDATLTDPAVVDLE